MVFIFLTLAQCLRAIIDTFKIENVLHIYLFLIVPSENSLFTYTSA